jgi:hypothetical protein
MKNRSNHARHHAGLILALIGLIGVPTLVLGPARLTSAYAVAPSWSYTGNLNTAREFGHTATLLPNGKVLVAGGSVDVTFCPCATGTAELYNPTAGTWINAGNLVRPRTGHTATLLPTGKVLVAGGDEFGGPGGIISRTAELYDPATDSWSTTGNLNIARRGHTATLLQNGKVLVAGGVNGNAALNSAELYDPATGAWNITGNLNGFYDGHTTTLLHNGKVLVVLGKTAELYDPTTGTWHRTGDLNTAHSGLHTATLLSDGQVLVTGGFVDLDFENPPTNRTELYDPETETWSNTGSLNVGRDSHTATLLPGGKVLVAGGEANHIESYLQSAELYDPASGMWSNTANLNTGRLFHTATLLLNGKVLAAGAGASGFETAELYDSGTNQNPNLIDDTQFFVRQHYRDFLNREPDPDGLNFWTGEIFTCGSDPQCIEVKRINDSASFFLSIEFQETGYLVYRIYKASYGNLPNTPVPIKLNEFLPDTQDIGKNVIVKQAGWEQVLENNKRDFATAFVQRQRFVTAYATSLSPDAFVDALFANAGVIPSSADRAAAIAEFGTATNTSDTAARARTLRRVAENSTLAQQEFSRAFVLIQYFGYLRRNPNDAPEATLDFKGYNFWLNKLNQFNGNYIQAEMVKAFISSSEYRRRFEP